MTESWLSIAAGERRASGDLRLDARFDFITDEPGSYICTRKAASADPGDCPGLIWPGQPHLLVTLHGRPLLRWCDKCAPGIAGKAFSDWMAGQ